MFLYDFKHTYLRLTSILIIGGLLLFLFFHLNREYYPNIVIMILTATCFYAPMIYATTEIILFGYRNMKKQSDIWGYLKILLQMAILSFTAFFIIVISIFLNIEKY